MQKLKTIYQRTTKQTQNRLQELFDTFNFTSENIYNIADNKTKKRINTYIEQWKEQGLLKNNSYFTVLANNIYKRTKVKNSEILDICGYTNKNILYLWGKVRQKLLIFRLKYAIILI